MLLGEEHDCHAAQAEGHADAADQQQRLAAELVDEGHGKQRGDQVHGADGDGLQIARDLAEAGHAEDVVRVIENGVDAGELVERRDGERQIDGTRYLR